MMTPLTALSPLDGRYASKVCALSDFFSEYALMKYRFIIEVRWLQTLCAQLPDLTPLSPAAINLLDTWVNRFSQEDAETIKSIEASTHHDVKAVEYFLKEKMSHDAELAVVCEYSHFACTSDDINNLAYACLVRDATRYLLSQYNLLAQTLTDKATEYASYSMLSRTHGQAATPTTLGKEFANTCYRLQRQLTLLSAQTFLGKCNGAVGNYNAHLVAYPEIDWADVSKNFVTSLGLTWNPYTTQIEPHDFLAELFDTLARSNTLLIDFSRDIWGYISLGYFTQHMTEHHVGSSTMPHKVNPIHFENAEGNFGIANSLFRHFSATLPISRFQRDLSDSTLMRNIGVAFGHTLIALQSLLAGLAKIQAHLPALNNDLHAHWDVLAEALQTVMRRYAIPHPYETLKALTRGKTVDQSLLHEFIESLPLNTTIKQHLYSLTPFNYTGMAEQLANALSEHIHALKDR